MSDAILKLTHAAGETAEALPFERRRENRRAVNAQVTALRTADRRGGNHRICSLQMLNMSDSGLGAIADVPLDIGSSLAVFFPPHGPERGFDLFGHVVRCAPSAAGCEIGVRFDVRAAA